MAALYVVVSLLARTPFDMVDLGVYLEGSRHLGDGTLYEFATPGSRLPFTYPPFSALVFWPLSWLPWPVARVLWQLASVAAIAAISHLTLRLISRDFASTRTARETSGLVLFFTGVACWLEPVRSTLNYGQIGLFLTAGLLAGLSTRRDWLAGVTVGLTAGVKLIPAITGLYYLLARRLAVVVSAAVVGAATILVALVVLSAETGQYFRTTIFALDRAGPTWAVNNQSLRGALARIVGADTVALWLVAAALVLGLAVLATRSALAAGDRTGAFLAVQFAGLLVSPISWVHHWVWVLPLLIWAGTGPRRRNRGVRLLAAAWWVAGGSFFLSVRIAAAASDTSAARPAWLAAVDAIYPALGVITLLVIWRSSAQKLTRPRVRTRRSGH